MNQYKSSTTMVTLQDILNNIPFSATPDASQPEIPKLILGIE
jgi:hypothetical protein